LIEASANIGVQRSVCALLVVRSVIFYRVGRPPFYRHKEGRCTCTGDHGSCRLLPESRGCSDRVLWEVHCGVWRRSWQSSWASSLTPSHRTSDPGPASRSGTGPVSPRVLEVENAQHLWPRTRTPASGFGTSTCHPDSCGWVRDLHVPSGLPRALDSASCSGGVRSRHVSRRRGHGRRSRRRPGSSGRHGRCCGGYHPPGVAWRRSEGPTGQGLVPVKAGAASEGRGHAVRGLCGRESTKEVWGVGSIVAGAVPSTSCTASQVPTVPPQRPEWRSSGRCWRTRPR